MKLARPRFDLRRRREKTYQERFWEKRIQLNRSNGVFTDSHFCKGQRGKNHNYSWERVAILAYVKRFRSGNLGEVEDSKRLPFGARNERSLRSRRSKIQKGPALFIADLGNFQARSRENSRKRRAHVPLSSLSLLSKRGIS